MINFFNPDKQKLLTNNQLKNSIVIAKYFLVGYSIFSFFILWCVFVFINSSDTVIIILFLDLIIGTIFIVGVSHDIDTYKIMLELRRLNQNGKKTEKK